MLIAFSNDKGIFDARGISPDPKQKISDRYSKYITVLNGLWFMNTSGQIPQRLIYCCAGAEAGESDTLFPMMKNTMIHSLKKTCFGKGLF